jgi:hypothetical protein
MGASWALLGEGCGESREEGGGRLGTPRFQLGRDEQTKGTEEIVRTMRKH